MSDTNPSLRKLDIGSKWKKLFLFFLVISPLIFLIFYAVPAFFLTAPDAKAPWVSWYDDPHQRVYLSWETEEASIGVVNYGSNYPSNLTLNVAETEAKLIHHVNLTGLLANTKYYYEVVIAGEVYGSGSFKTAPIGYESFVFGMISDTQQSFGQGFHNRIAAAIDPKEYAFIANVGDIVDNGDDKRYYNDFFSVASLYFDSIPFAPVIGNHDNYKPSIFQTYYKNTVDSSESLFYYSFNYSSIHFQMLHLPYGKENELTETKQLEWIKQDLQNAQSLPFRISMFHCPIISSSFFNNNEFLIENLLPVFLQYNVTAIISGHDHHWERGLIEEGGKELMFMVLGSGGGFQDPGVLPSPETKAITVTPCYTEVYATANLLNFKTYTPYNDLIDDYTIYAGGAA